MRIRIWWLRLRGRQPEPVPEPTPYAAPGLVHGLAAARTDDIAPFEANSGRFVRRFTYYRSLGSTTVNFAWERDNLRKLVARGTTPVVTLQPQDPTRGVDQPDFCHARIVTGACDAVLCKWAQTIAAAGGPVVVRPMHEANGDWYPWCSCVNGNSAESFRDAWRHVRAVMIDAGATNARWLWSPNRSSATFPIVAVYPGSDVVDEIGFSGYNGGTAVDRGGWRSFEEIFSSSVAEAAELGPGKPIHIAETGSVEEGGDKAGWITDMWAWLRAHPTVAGVTWFNVPKGGADWRIETSEAAQAAYRAGAIVSVPPRT